jgi:uncharacterized secreted protein with C-terminal beta-propeller domain
MVVLCMDINEGIVYVEFKQVFIPNPIVAVYATEVGTDHYLSNAFTLDTKLPSQYSCVQLRSWNLRSIVSCL